MNMYFEGCAPFWIELRMIWIWIESGSKQDVELQYKEVDLIENELKFI